MLEVVGHPYLRNVLNGGQSRGHETEEVGPEVELVRQGNGKHSRQCNHNQSVEDAEAAHGEGGLPSGALSAKLILGHVGFAVAEEDEKQDEATAREAKKLAGLSETDVGQENSDSHGSEAQPLYSELGNTKQARSTFESVELSAAANGVARGRHGQDVGEAGGGRSGAQQDEIGRYAFGGAARDDAIVLGEVRDQKADKDDAAVDCQNRGPEKPRREEGSSHGHSQLDVGGRLEAVAGRGRGHGQGRGVHGV